MAELRRASRLVWSVPGAVLVLAASAVPTADAQPPDGCRAWGRSNWSSATCDATVGGEYRAVAYCSAFNAGSKSVFGYVLPFNDTEYGRWHAAGSGEDSTAQCNGGYYLSDPSVQTRP